mgnify:CR=1 FL=1
MQQTTACHAPLCIDLFCGLGGWAEGFLAEGYRVIGFDVERHDYGTGGYPGQLVLQDVLTLHGSQFRNATVIVASPPCQEYSYMAMPWSRAKKIAAEYRDGTRDVKDLTRLFDACFRIQREACEAAGRYIPMVVENVCGAQKWLGRAAWHYGSYYLWGDVPAIMPITFKIKNTGGSWFGQRNGEALERNDPRYTRADATVAVKVPSEHGRRTTPGNRSSARKAASAQIAKIPFDLARYIAMVYKPEDKKICFKPAGQPGKERSTVPIDS